MRRMTGLDTHAYRGLLQRGFTPSSVPPGSDRLKVTHLGAK
jgi:hypothetical protein